jgi:uncharacterized protein YxeA
MRKIIQYIIIVLLIVILISIVLYQMYRNDSLFKEAFTWSMKEKHDFENYNKLNLPNTQFDLTMLQKQASPKELQFFFKHGYWHWTEETKSIFLEELGRSSLIKSDPNISLLYYQKIYNENAVQQLLRWQTNEGKFVLRGATIPDGTKYQCQENDDGSSSMFKFWTDGYNLWNGYANSKKEKVENGDLPTQIPGFSFVKGECSPCDNLNYAETCPFHLKLQRDKEISPIWKMNWGIVGF